MKGIAHFISGIAAASFIPAAVQQSAQGVWVLALAGACALLPDTLDFKFARFLEQADDAIDPGPQPNAQALADRIAAVADVVFQTGCPRTVHLHTVRIGADAWQQYAVRFDTPLREIAACLGLTVAPWCWSYRGAISFYLTLPVSSRHVPGLRRTGNKKRGRIPRRGRASKRPSERRITRSSR